LLEILHLIGRCAPLPSRILTLDKGVGLLVDVDTACKAIETSRWIRNDAIATQSLAISHRGQSAQLRGYSASLLAVSSTETCRAQRLAKKVK
jgi:hypothetical protein